jgi:hypothetical protein
MFMIRHFVVSCDSSDERISGVSFLFFFVFSLMSNIRNHNYILYEVFQGHINNKNECNIKYYGLVKH